MTSLHFAGDLPLIAGLGLALLVAVMSWRYYRRESFDLSHRLRWILPLLRSLALFLGIMVLTGPVLHHRKTIGELGRVKIYVDASQSMNLLDRHNSPGRKLLIAEQQGWLEKGRVDARLLNMADKLSDVRRSTMTLLQQESVSPQRIGDAKDSLLAELITAKSSLSNSDECSSLIQTLENIAVPTNDESSESAVSGLLAVCDSTRSIEQKIRSTFNDDIQRLVDSGDQSILAALAMFDETPRWRRAERSLLEVENSLFEDLREHHHLEVLALQNQTAVELLDGQAVTDVPDELPESPDAATTDLTSGVTLTQARAQASQQDGDSDNGSSKPNTAIVLLTDGQHNAGPSPLQTARILGGQGVSFFPVSLGATNQAPDLAVKGVEHPEMVFQKDQVRGTLVVRDRMPAGQPLVAQVEFDGEVLWQQQLLTDNSGERRIPFEFEIEDLVEQLGSNLEADIKHHAVPLRMKASVTPLLDEAETANNERPMRFAAITESHRMLIIDGRSRWETRYLRNAFQRDNQWDVNVVIAGPGTSDEAIPRGDGKDKFPDTRDGLFAYDLIIFGEVQPQLLSEHEYKWIREFVEVRGGGIIFVDGQRDRLKQFTEQNLEPLLPVEWLPDAKASQPTILQLTSRGQGVPSLTLEADKQKNERFWNELPAPHRVNMVKVVPGAESLVDAVVDGSPTPVMVSRNYGSGRVLYLAFDETWRWRYKAADTWHQRIWNQLANYVMPRPFASSDEFLAIDTGPVSYESGDSADIRIRLRGLDGKPAADATVDALLWKEGKIVGTASLTPDSDVPGMYRGDSEALSDGEYEVSIRASGFSQEALKARGQFVVRPAESGELDETGCNEPLLQQMAAASGGVYLREEQLGELPELLNPLSSGRVVKSDTILWQSYWWFTAIILLLTLEWFLRKRAGLL